MESSKVHKIQYNHSISISLGITIMIIEHVISNDIIAQRINERKVLIY